MDGPTRTIAEPPVDTTLGEREARYASFRDNSSVAQQLKNVMRASPNWDKAPSYIQEALDMIASKISRQLTGDLLYADNMHDIEGYARLMQHYASEDRNPTPEPDYRDLRETWLEQMRKGGVKNPEELFRG